MTPTRRRMLFAAAAVVMATTAGLAVLLGVDVYLHGRYEKSAGFNVWGYRGRPVGKKAAGEYRIVVLGGSAAYGYGVGADDAMPAVLQRLLRGRASSPLFTVVNLGYNNEGAYSFRTTLEDYRWLDYDLAVLYEGYNDMSPVRPNLQVFRHESPMFRLTGYMPIFPIIFEEKAAAMISGGDAGAFYRRGEKTVFHASLATRASAGVIGATAEVARALEAQLGRVTEEPVHSVDERVTSGCSSRWGVYCHSVESAVQYVREHGKQVLVGTQPYLRADAGLHATHMAQQSELRAMLARRFGTDSSVGYVDLGDLVDLEDRQMSFDHMHLTEDGNRKAAAVFVEPVLTMAARATQKNS
jgi:hypothetical protein